LEKSSVRDEDSEKSWGKAEDSEKSSVRDEDSEKLLVRGEDLEKSSAKVTAASCQEWASQIRGFADFEPALARAPQLD
jgi:hypothetical protein